MTLIQVRNVPEDVHRKLKSRAAAEGRTLSDYIRLELERLAAQPTLEEFFARVDERGHVPLPPGAAARAVRDGRREAGRE